MHMARLRVVSSPCLADAVLVAPTQIVHAENLYCLPAAGRAPGSV